MNELTYVYTIPAILCFIIFIFTSKYVEGEVFVKDVLVAILVSIVPIVNILIIVLSFMFCVSKLYRTDHSISNFLCKKLF